MADRKKIPTPWAHRWRRFRYSALPFITFFALLVLTFSMWNAQSRRPNGKGYVEAPRVDVAAAVDGQLLATDFPEMFEMVSQGQEIAYLDDKVTKQELATMELRIKRERQQIEAELEQWKLERDSTAQANERERTRFQRENDQRELDIAQLRLDIHDARFDLYTVKRQADRAKAVGLVDPVSKQQLQDLVTHQAHIEESLVQLDEQLEKLTEQRDFWRQALKDFQELGTVDEVTFRNPLDTALAEEESRLKELTVLRNQLVVKSPIDGMVTAIYIQPGQIVRGGEPILAVSDSQGQFIISYVRQDQKLDPLPEGVVFVRAMSAGSQLIKTEVSTVGARIERVPLHQRRDPRMPEWGLPVRIRLPQELQARPGEIVDVLFETERRGLFSG